MASGVKCSQECIDTFNKMKLKKEGIPFIIFRLTDDLKQIVIDNVGPSTLTTNSKDGGDAFTQFKKFLTEAFENGGHCRYAVFDTARADTNNSKLIFILWANDDANPREKMVYASSKENFKKQLDGVASKDLNANSFEDLTFEALQAKASSN